MFKLYLAYKAVQAVTAAVSTVATVAPYIAGGVMAVQAGAYVAPKLIGLAREGLQEPRYVRFPITPHRPRAGRTLTSSRTVTLDEMPDDIREKFMRAQQKPVVDILKTRPQTF